LIHVLVGTPCRVGTNPALDFMSICKVVVSLVQNI
jgi:hypothetical protein